MDRAGVECLVILTAIITVAGLGGCGAVIDARSPLPAELVESAEIPDIQGVRYWGDVRPVEVIAELRKHFTDTPPIGAHAERIAGRPVIEVLAITGGGANGAFGAGVLSGWSKTGHRPEFELVTGVSAGGLIAPFAFLGAHHDDKLRQIWTQYQTRDLVRVAGLPGLLGGDSLADTKPLFELIQKYVDRSILDEIAAEYRRGRYLLVLTTNLDAQRPVVWNMGAIAASQSPGAADLFHKVLLASAAVPGAFSPVRITVKAGGRLFDELHVDGGVTQQVFVTPLRAPIRAFDPLFPKPPINRFYILENGKQSPVYKSVDQRTLPIATRAIQTLLTSQTEGQIYRIYRRVRDADARFALLSIPPSFPYEPEEVFDKAYQKKLFDVGVALGSQPNPWQARPPELVPTARRPKPSETKPIPRTDGDTEFGAESFFAAH